VQRSGERGHRRDADRPRDERGQRTLEPGGDQPADRPDAGADDRKERRSAGDVPSVERDQPSDRHPRQERDRSRDCPDACPQGRRRRLSGPHR
jgi:hypothetical protein